METFRRDTGRILLFLIVWGMIFPQKEVSLDQFFPQNLHYRTKKEYCPEPSLKIFHLF